MLKHNFTYTIIEEYVDVKNIVKKIKKIKLKKDNNLPDMNYTSYENNDDKLKQILKDELKDILNKYKLNIRYCWVQKYFKNNFHNVHTHNGNETSFIWFIDGNKDCSPVKFYDVGYPLVDTNKGITINFKPGILLLFPGFIPHEVPPNKSNNRLIVSGNVF